MDIDEEIKARLHAAKTWDKDVKLEDFQITASGNGFVLINLKTRRADLVHYDDSERAGAALFSAAQVRLRSRHCHKIGEQAPTLN